MSNPWLPTPSKTVDEPAAPVRPIEPTGASAPQPSVTPPDASEQLRVWTTSATSRVWVVGTHGGSGETTLAQLLGGTATGHRWPSATEPPAVVLTARTHASGLRAAQLAMRAWAAAETPHIRLLGLVLVADAPGKLPKPLAELAEILRGGVPHTWQLPWVDAYRLEVDVDDTPRQVRKILTEINTLIDTTN
jgi:hypothetical protein